MATAGETQRGREQRLAESLHASGNMSRVELNRFNTTTPGVVKQPCPGSLDSASAAMAAWQPNPELQPLASGLAVSVHCVTLPCLRAPKCRSQACLAVANDHVRHTPPRPRWRRQLGGRCSARPGRSRLPPPHTHACTTPFTPQFGRFRLAGGGRCPTLHYGRQRRARRRRGAGAPQAVRLQSGKGAQGPGRRAATASLAPTAPAARRGAPTCSTARSHGAAGVAASWEPRQPPPAIGAQPSHLRSPPAPPHCGRKGLSD